MTTTRTFKNFTSQIEYFNGTIKVIIPIGKNIRCAIEIYNSGKQTYSIGYKGDGTTLNNSGADYVTTGTDKILVNVSSNYETVVGYPTNNSDLYFEIVSSIRPGIRDDLYLVRENYKDGILYSYTTYLNPDKIVNPSFTPPLTPSSEIEYKSGVTSTTATNGSLIYNFFDSNNNLLETFEVIPGHLDTITLSDGNYADFAIPVIFNKLNNYIYSESILDNIQNVLAAFFPSIALQQKNTENIIRLTQKLISGEINIDQFNELVTLEDEEFASEYGRNYAINYVKLQIAIQKYKYILVNFY